MAFIVSFEVGCSSKIFCSEVTETFSDPSGTLKIAPEGAKIDFRPRSNLIWLKLAKLRGVCEINFFDLRPPKKVRIFVQFRPKPHRSDHGRTPSQFFAQKVLIPRLVIRQIFLRKKTRCKLSRAQNLKSPGDPKVLKKIFENSNFFFRQIVGPYEPTLWSKDELFEITRSRSTAVWKSGKIGPKWPPKPKTTPTGPQGPPGTKPYGPFFIPSGYLFDQG